MQFCRQRGGVMYYVDPTQPTQTIYWN